MDANSIISVLLVEDEIAVRRSLVGKLKRDASRKYDIKEASHAEEAYEIIKRTPPNLVFLDMRMPGMGGAAFLRILKDEFPFIKVIVLSGYSDFPFVQQAIKCGASDYLLKPIINEELYEAVERAVNEFISEKKQIRLGIERDMMLRESIHMLKTSLLNALLNKTYIRAEEVIEKLRYLQIDFRYPRYMAAFVRIVDFDAIKEFYMRDASLVFFALENVMNESMTVEKGRMYGFKNERVENEYVCVFGFDGDESEMTKKLAADFTRVIDNIRKYNKMDIQVYLGGAFEHISDLHSVYRMTSYGWKGKDVAKTPGLFLYEHNQDEMGDEALPDWTAEDTQALSDSLQEGAIGKISALVNRCFRPIEHLQVIPHAIMGKLESGLFQTIQQFTDWVQPSSDGAMPPSLLHFQQSVYQYDSPIAMKHAVLKVLTDLAEWLSQDSRNGAKGVVMRVKSYIDTHYYEELTLADLAVRFFINRTYLSEKFKEVTGYPFSKYVNMVRIEKAKEFMMEKGMKVDYIASLVGFNDPAYFSTVFKNLTGHTVKEYEMKLRR